MAEQTYHDVLLEQSGYTANVKHAVADLGKGGAFGWSPVWSQWMSNQAERPNNLVCILLRSPGFFKAMNNPQVWHRSLKHMFEVHARKWEGFNGTLTPEFAEHQFGGGGPVQHELVDVKYEPTTPKWNGVEKKGGPVELLTDYWIRYGGMDPFTKLPLTNTLPALINGPDREALKREAAIASWSTASAIFFEPDNNFQDVKRAWTVVNMFPKTGVPVERRMDKNSALELVEIDMEFTGMADYSDGSIALAQALLKRINIMNADPKMRDSWITNIDPTLLATGGGFGVDTGPIQGFQGLV